jgi:hypothetical protein
MLRIPIETENGKCKMAACMALGVYVAVHDAIVKIHECVALDRC